MLQCHYTRARLPAFLNGELPTATRRYVARHLEVCPRCRALHAAQRTTRDTLLRELPLVGQPDERAKARVWERISIELRPQPIRVGAVPRVRVTAQWVSGMAGALTVLLLILPLALTGSPTHSAVPQPPQPLIMLTATRTPQLATRPFSPTSVAQVAQTAPGKMDTPSYLQNTPAPLVTLPDHS